MSAALIIAMGVVIAFLFLQPAPSLTVVTKQPVTQVEFANPSGLAINFFYFTEVQTNGQWTKANPQPKGAQGANHAKGNTKQQWDIVPVPSEAKVWRVGVSYQRAGTGSGLPWHLQLAAKLGLFKKTRDEYFAFTTVYAEVNP